MVFLCLFLSFAVYSLIPLRSETGEPALPAAVLSRDSTLGCGTAEWFLKRYQVADDEALYWDLATIVGIFHSIFAKLHFLSLKQVTS